MTMMITNAVMIMFAVMMIIRWMKIVVMMLERRIEKLHYLISFQLSTVCGILTDLLSLAMYQTIVSTYDTALS